MGKIVLFAAAILTLSVCANAEKYDQYEISKTNQVNNYPVVLLHGFVGWGRDELLGFKYWGGFSDLQTFLRSEGYETYTGTVGPVSSNWDRAVELYTYLKGGTVDYGKSHSKKYGHERFGTTFPGILKDWGEEHGNRKIHLIGHSLGTQTSRVFVTLLNQGSEAERQASPDDLSPLFEGEKDWVMSVTALSGCHDGSTVAHPKNPTLKELEADTAGIMGSALTKVKNNGSLYDFKLDQWGLQRLKGEPHTAYKTRILSSPIWMAKDISFYDASPDGAAILNAKNLAQPNTYYFSWSTEATVPDGGGHKPRLSMDLGLQKTSKSMISFRYRGDDGILIDDTWAPNDGMVNTRSQAGPTLNSSDTIIHLQGKKLDEYHKGVWYHMGVKDGWDHLDIIGIATTYDYQLFYLEWAKHLVELPDK